MILLNNEVSNEEGQLITRSACLAKNNPRGFVNFKEKPDFIGATLLPALIEKANMLRIFSIK